MRENPFAIIIKFKSKTRNFFNKFSLIKSKYKQMNQKKKHFFKYNTTQMRGKKHAIGSRIEVEFLKCSVSF